MHSKWSPNINQPACLLVYYWLLANGYWMNASTLFFPLYQLHILWCDSESVMHKNVVCIRNEWGIGVCFVWLFFWFILTKTWRATSGQCLSYIEHIVMTMCAHVASFFSLNTERASRLWYWNSLMLYRNAIRQHVTETICLCCIGYCNT